MGNEFLWIERVVVEHIPRIRSLSKLPPMTESVSL